MAKGTVADRIRQFVNTTYVQPAKSKRDYVVGVRAGDIGDCFTPKPEMTQVAGALGTNEFEELASVKRVAVLGPMHGRNALFVYLLVPQWPPVT